MIHAAQGRREVSLMSLERHRWKKRRRRSHEYFSSVVRERTCKKLKKLEN